MAETISQPLSKLSHKGKFETMLLLFSSECESAEHFLFLFLIKTEGCFFFFSTDYFVVSLFCWTLYSCKPLLGEENMCLLTWVTVTNIFVYMTAVWKCVQALILYHAQSLCGFVTVDYLHLSHFHFVYLCKPLYCVIVFYYYIWIGMHLYRECLSTFQSFCMVLKGLHWSHFIWTKTVCCSIHVI